MVFKTETLKLAAKLARDYERNYQAYIAEVEADYQDGHRAHYCEHGVNLWTDYDPICGACEAGVSMGNGLQRRRAALDEAKARSEQYDAMVSAVCEVVRVFGNDSVLNMETVIARMKAVHDA